MRTQNASVIPAQAGIQGAEVSSASLGPAFARLRGGDVV
jgi:hypothetical protein